MKLKNLIKLLDNLEELKQKELTLRVNRPICDKYESSESFINRNKEWNDKLNSIHIKIIKLLDQEI